MITDEFRHRPYNYFYDKIVGENKTIFDSYNQSYERIKNNHPVFSKGWQCNFFFPHRYMNWIIYAFITENISKDKTIFDVGCYDAMLVKVLCDQGYNAYGYNYNGYTKAELDWDEMYRYLDIRDRVNTLFEENPDVVVMFNYHHNFKPSELIPAVKESCFGKTPEMAFFDTEVATGHPNNKLYYNQDTLNEIGIKIVGFPECEKYNERTQRELMIWQK